VTYLKLPLGIKPCRVATEEVRPFDG